MNRETWESPRGREYLDNIIDILRDVEYGVHPEDLLALGPLSGMCQLLEVLIHGGNDQWGHERCLLRLEYALRESWEEWRSFSGWLLYPIPHPGHGLCEDAARDKYHNTRRIDKWGDDTEYSVLRCDLAGYTADVLEEWRDEFLPNSEEENDNV